MSQLIYLIEITVASTQAAANNALRQAVGLDPEDLQYDMDGDGRVTVRDALKIMRTGGLISELVLRYCTGHGYTTAPTDTPANTFYEPRVTDPGLFRQSMFAVGTTGGKSTPGFGNIVLTNVDGGLDALVDYGFDGRQCVVKSGYKSQPLSEFATLITGTIEQAEFSWGQITLRLKDRSMDMDTPVQTRKYAGTNSGGAGVEGESELKDKPKPRLFGSCRNITPVLVNKDKLIYQVNDGAIYDIPAVHDGGNVGKILQGPDYATPALLEDAAVGLTDGQPASLYSTCKAAGLFMLDQKPVGAITCEAVQGGAIANRTVGQIIKQLAGEKCGPEYVVQQSIIDLDKAAPYEVGLYIDRDMTTAAALDQLCNSVGAWWGFDNLGYFWAKQLTTPDVTQALTTLTQSEILEIDRQATSDGDRGLPTYKVNVDYDRNCTVQTSGLVGALAGDALTFGDTSANLTTGRAAELAMEYRRVTAIDAAVKTLHINAPELTVKTLLTTQANAQAEADRLLAMRKVRRDRLRVKVSTKAVSFPDAGYWDDEAIAEIVPYRNGHSVCLYGDYAYLVGGIDEANNIIATAFRFDMRAPNGAWDDAGITDLPYPCSGHNATVHNGYLYVIGGTSVYGGSSSFVKCCRLNMSNPNGAWEMLADLPAALSIGGMGVVVHNNYIYVGGFDSSFKTYRINTANLGAGWDDAGVTDLPVKLNGPQFLTGNLWVIMGAGWPYTDDFNVYSLDLTNPTGAWSSSVFKPLTFLAQFNAAVIYDGYVWVIGGGRIRNKSPKTWRLNLATPQGDWEEMAVLPLELTQSRGVVYNGILYCLGGRRQSTSPTNTTTFRYRRNVIAEDQPQLTSLGRTIKIQHPRYGYTSGRPMRIIGTESNYRDGETVLELWG